MIRPDAVMRTVLLGALTAIAALAWYGYQHDQLLVLFANIPFCG